MFTTSLIERERGDEIGEKNYNVVFYGNPGTGKTTVASIYERLLKDLEVLPEAALFEKTSGVNLIEAGISGLNNILGKFKEKGGGLLFIDEAYSLHGGGSQPNTQGKKLIEFLLPDITTVQSKYGRLVIVMAGYRRQMEQVMEMNDGLNRRFRKLFEFKDYSDDELIAILEKKLETNTPSMQAEDAKHVRIAARRIGRARGTRGFGNAGAIDAYFKNVVLPRQAKRIDAEKQRGKFPNLHLLKRDDLLGARTSVKRLQADEAYTKLNEMIGLKNVKVYVDSLIRMVADNESLEDEELPVKKVNLNVVFVGNPGTGKV